MKKFIRPILSFCVIFLPLLLEAQWKSINVSSEEYTPTYRLKYQPNGIILKFCVDSLTFYTDTNSLFKAYKRDRVMNKYFTEYFSRITRLVRNRIKENKSDTITFEGKWISFEDSLPEDSIPDRTTFKNYWYTKYAILVLTRDKKVVIFDKHNQQVKVIKTKLIKKNYILGRNEEVLYINRKTKEVLFSGSIDLEGFNEWIR